MTRENIEHFNILWEDNFDNLPAFQRRFGHARVPPELADDPRLSNWARSQRRLKARGMLLEWRERQLDDLGFS